MSIEEKMEGNASENILEGGRIRGYAEQPGSRNRAVGGRMNVKLKHVSSGGGPVWCIGEKKVVSLKEGGVSVYTKKVSDSAKIPVRKGERNGWPSMGEGEGRVDG